MTHDLQHGDELLEEVHNPSPSLENLEKSLAQIVKDKKAKMHTLCKQYFRISLFARMFVGTKSLVRALFPHLSGEGC